MNVLIIANSSVKEYLSDVSGYDTVIVLDGAGNYVTHSFDYLIGDLDSLENHKLEDYREKIVHKPDQNFTDLHKGIMHADELGATKIDIVNALGGRIDHTMANIRTLKTFHSKDRHLRIIDSSQSLEYYEDCEIEIIGKMGDHIGIMAAPNAFVTSEGLKYNMKDAKLEWGGSESNSNSFAATSVILKIKGGILLNLYLPQDVRRC